MILHLDLTRALQYFSKENYIKISIAASILTIFVITDILLSNISPVSRITAQISYNQMQESFFSYFFLLRL